MIIQSRCFVNGSLLSCKTSRKLREMESGEMTLELSIPLESPLRRTVSRDTALQKSGKMNVASGRMCSWLLSRRQRQMKRPKILFREHPEMAFLQQWRMGFTKQGFFGLVPQPTAEGDIVVVLFGANVPVILRRTSNPGTFEYHLIGPACIMALTSLFHA